VLMSQAMSTTRGKTLTSKFQNKGTCDSCENAHPTRLTQWRALCDACAGISDVHFFSSNSDKSLGVKRTFPLEHRGMKSCQFCKKDDLVILYDELDDEWLFCVSCKKAKQLLRCWNQYAKKLVDCLERPIVKMTNTPTEV
jgi:hypothetical protein